MAPVPPVGGLKKLMLLLLLLPAPADVGAINAPPKRVSLLASGTAGVFSNDGSCMKLKSLLPALAAVGREGSNGPGGGRYKASSGFILSSLVWVTGDISRTFGVATSVGSEVTCDNT